MNSKNISPTIICDYCEATVTKHNIAKHKKSETCTKIQSLLSKKDILYNELLEKYKNSQTKITKFEQEIITLKKQNEEKDLVIKTLEDNSEECIKIEKTIDNKHKFKHQNNFEIDISLNNKQINRIKYKDVPEEVVKKDIQSLTLKDNYQLEYREEDGYINITNLCKAGGKEFKSWNRLDKTKRFLEVLGMEVKINTSDLIKIGSGCKFGTNIQSGTWAHPQVAINISQWISPEFDVMVSRWIYQIMLTGKFDIKDKKTTQELDEMNKENKLLKNRIKLLESKVLQKQKREVFEENKNVIYIVTTEYKEAQGHYKIGKAQNLQKRLSTYNTTEKHEVIYNTSCKNKKIMDVLETMIHTRLDNCRIEPNHEWFKSEEDAEDFIKIIEECKKVINI
jgi:hypothetical protein